MNVPCDRCGGKGKISRGNCPKCRGRKVELNAKTLVVDVERGMKNK